MFYIHKKEDGSLYVYYDYSAHDGRIRGSAGVVLKDGETLLKMNKASKNRLSRISMYIEEYVDGCKLANIPTEKEKIKAIVLQELGKKIITNKLTVLGLVETYRDEAIKGTVFNYKGVLHAEKTINQYTTIVNKLQSDPIGNILIERLSEQDIRAFTGRLTHSYKHGNKKNGKISTNSVSSYNNIFASVLSATFELGWHGNKVAKSELSFSAEVIDYAVYYSIPELQRLYAHKFEKIEDEQLRDVFIFGCFTCLRYSDYYATDYKQAVKGSEMTIKLKKKGNQVKVPLHPIALQILNKYGYKLPKIESLDFNLRIKKIVKLAGFDDKVLFTRTHGGELKREYKEKWELTTSHTMRRSFATNALKNGLEQWSVMSIGGWKSDASFKKYLRMSKEDVKEAAFGSAFYKVTM